MCWLKRRKKNDEQIGSLKKVVSRHVHSIVLDVKGRDVSSTTYLHLIPSSAATFFLLTVCWVTKSEKSIWHDLVVCEVKMWQNVAIVLYKFVQTEMGIWSNSTVSWSQEWLHIEHKNGKRYEAYFSPQNGYRLAKVTFSDLHVCH